MTLSSHQLKMFHSLQTAPKAATSLTLVMSLLPPLALGMMLGRCISSPKYARLDVNPASSVASVEPLETLARTSTMEPGALLQENITVKLLI